MIFRKGMTDTVWVSQDGRKIPVVEMSDRHLANAIRIVTRSAMELMANTGATPEAVAKAVTETVPCFPLMLRERNKRGLNTTRASAKLRCPTEPS